MAANPEITILFAPLNSPGHLSSSLVLADHFRSQYSYRTVFVVVGDLFGYSIEDRGHELIKLPEKSPFYDYELSDNETTEDQSAAKAVDKQQRAFSGCYKWPQFVLRYQSILAVSPLEARCKAIPMFEDIMFQDLMDNNDGYAECIAQVKPQLIIADTYLMPAAIVDSKIPWVKLHSANPLALTNSRLPGGEKPTALCGYSIKTKQERDKMRREQPDRWQALLDKWKSDAQLLEQANDPRGRVAEKFLNGRDQLEFRVSKQLNLYLYPKYLDYDQDDDILGYPPRVVRCQSLISCSKKTTIDARNNIWAHELAKKSAGRQSVVFFSLGTIASGNVKLMKRFVDIFKQDTKRVYVISKGINGDKFELDGDNLLGANYLPQTFFLQKVDLAIIHGGNNTITECLYFGLPMIVLPCFADQLDNAQRVEDLALGKRLGLDVSGSKLLTTVESVLSNAELVARCKQAASNTSSKGDHDDECKRVCLMLNKLALDGELTDETIEAFKREQ